ncbi:hypothetical protein BCR22_14735 [Enterococcus plantarum]|uniref:DUF1310 family protein n=1 Tax=Enterococcus plantarum TaxID=1077675 RepID=UPI00084D976F|nr:DUF1310 family protein [Enterococcus plantarum]OEG11728.1 hypothetical protein BCR22_14735 [Enterococcus plantarum]
MTKRKFIVIGVGIVLVIILGIGGKVYMDNKRFNDEMVNVVKTGQAKREIEIGLKNLDSKALTPEGIIKSYEIDYESIEHNPMGGIMFDVIINDDEKLRVYNLLNKSTKDGTLENSGGGNTAELEELLKKGGN